MIRQIFENGKDRLSCKRVCAMIFCITSIILSFLKYDFDTICLLVGACVSLLGVGLMEINKDELKVSKRVNNRK